MRALLKWIVCRMPATGRETFARSQDAWRALAGLGGFLGQLGGFPGAAGDEREACILGLWRDEPSYQAFMRERHDEIAARQGRPFTALEVVLADEILAMPGVAPDGIAALARARVLRAADCEVRPDRVDPFTRAQQRVWAPAMVGAGMLHGRFGRVRGAGDRFLVVSLWPDAATHDAYAREQVAGLRERAGTAGDLAALTGRVIELEPRFTVLPERA